MPELPEVELAARNLRRWALGRQVESARGERGAARIFRPASARALDGLVGARFRAVDRIGKNLLVTLDRRDGPVGIWSHLGMTGKWVRRGRGEPAPRFERVELALDDGARLCYVDLRLFGRLRLVPGARFDDVPDLRDLPPDPLTHGIDADALHARLSKSRLPIKVALLDQQLLPGVGNIQASEGLFRARLDPRRPARSLSRSEVDRLAKGLLASFEFTLAKFGAAGADGGGADVVYVEEDASQNPFLVYGREGERCPGCKRGTVKRIVQAGRSTFFCPDCQGAKLDDKEPRRPRAAKSRRPRRTAARAPR
jgi:formamidopyrimidine-DNA glycosylase